MTQLVGILNVTPDSFSDGGQFIEPEKAIAQAEKLFADGASLVDVGAESTRPNAEKLSVEKEWSRLKPVLRALLQKFPGKISLDSYKPEIFVKAFEIGPVIINDVTGMNNPDMIQTVANLNAKCIVSHIHDSDIQKMHEDVPTSTVEQVKTELQEKKEQLLDTGVEESSIILDPGIGFGKTMDLNWELLKFAEVFPENEVMIGYSRKRFLGDNRMEIEPNLEAGKIAIESGAAYLRVHDVAAHAQLIN